MAAPTREDAELMIQIAQWGTSLGVNDALPTLFADDFDPDAADPSDKPVAIVLAFGETIATLVKRELLSGELVHDWLWVQGMWERVAAAAAKAREKYGEPRLYENFEALARR